MKKILFIFLPFLLTGLMLGVIISLLRTSGGAQAAPAVGIITVNTLEDEQAADGDCSLRESIMAANTNQPVDACPAGGVLTDTIIFSVEGMITVTHQFSVTAGGPLVIDGGGVITTSGGGTTRVWWVDANSALTLQNLAVVDGYVLNENGAGLYNHGGSLTLVQSEFVNNQIYLSIGFEFFGGGIYAEGGTIKVLNSSFLENSSGDRLGHGGGIAAIDTTGLVVGTTFQSNSGPGCGTSNPCTEPGGGAIYLKNASVSIQESTFISNTSLAGGGIFNTMGTVTITHSSFSGNMGRTGAGIWNRGTMHIVNSSFINHHNIGKGGGIFNNGNMTITNSIFSGNSSGSGGAISTEISMVITNSIFSANLSSADGGAISNKGHMAISNSTFTGNNSITNGGAISNRYHITITGCTFSDNNAQQNGGGVANISVLPTIPPILIAISNSTFYGNVAGNHGGCIWGIEYRMIIANSTISGNSAILGGGISIEPFQNWTIPVTLTNTIVANSINGNDCKGIGIIIDGGHNLDSDGSCQLDPAVGSLPNTNPRLGPLQDNGGPTWTQALLLGSPAIDAGDNATCLPTDQRGVSRPLDGNGDGIAVCDIGAYEVDSPLIPNKVYMPLIFRN